MKFEYTVLLDIRNYTYIVIYPQYDMTFNSHVQ